MKRKSKLRKRRVDSKPSTIANQNHRHVVRATAIQSSENQMIDALLRRQLAACENRGDLIVIDFFGQSVRAQKNLNARRERAADRFDIEILRIGHAERLRDDIAVRMRSCLFVS